MSVDRIARELANAVQLHRAGKLEQASRAYAQIRTRAPRQFDAWHLGGTVSLQLGRVAEATRFLGQAHQLNPRDLVCLMRLGLAEMQAGQHAAAVVRLEKVVAAKPDFVDAWDNLGLARKQNGDLPGCIAAHRRTVALNPKYAQGWFNLGLALAVLGDMRAARECQERVLSLEPAHQRAASARLFALQYDDSVSQEDRFAAHRAFGDGLAQVSGGTSPSRAAKTRRNPGDPLRVGFLSSDLRQHSVPYFLEPLLTHFDHNALHVSLYHDHPAEDAVSDSLRKHARAWRNVYPLTDDALEHVLRADALDVLVDLNGHTGRNRLPVFARRVADVQVSYLGYPDTTGLRQMDYRFTDAIADPVGEADRWHTEKLVRFSECAWTYQPPHDAPEVPPLPSVQSGVITFGSFNHVAKIESRTLELWAGALQAVPNSRLVLKSMGLDQRETQERLFRDMRLAGIDQARVEFLPATRGIAQHLELYGRMDIALDTFPYHGTTTTCEALWMGRPVITLAGDRHVSRVGVSLLNAVGHPEWVASSAIDYSRITTELASHADRLRDTSSALRAQFRHAVLNDHSAQAARFVAALRNCTSDR